MTIFSIIFPFVTLFAMLYMFGVLLYSVVKRDGETAFLYAEWGSVIYMGFWVLLGACCIAYELYKDILTIIGVS